MKLLINYLLLFICCGLFAQSECTITIDGSGTPPTGCPQEPLFVGTDVVVYEISGGAINYGNIIYQNHLTPLTVETTFSVENPCHAVFLVSKYDCCGIIYKNIPTLVYEKCPECEPPILGFTRTEGCEQEKKILIRFGQ